MIGDIFYEKRTLTTAKEWLTLGWTQWLGVDKVIKHKRVACMLWQIFNLTRVPYDATNTKSIVLKG